MKKQIPNTLWHILTLLNKFRTSFSVCSSSYIRTKKMLTQIEREKIGVWFPYESQCMFIPNPTYSRFDSNSHETLTASHKVTTRTESHLPTHNHNTPQTSKKQRHHDLPHPPASSGFTCKGECNCRTIRCVIAHDLRNTAMHFWNVNLIIPLFYWLFFCWPLTSAIVDKR